MRTLKLLVVAAFAALTMALAAGLARTAPPQDGASRKSADEVRRERFRHNGVVENEDVPDPNAGHGSSGIEGNPTINAVESTGTEAPTGFDNLTNGYTDQGPDFATLNKDNVVALRSHNDNRFIFEQVETAEDGVG